MSEPKQAQAFTPAYRWYALWLLVVVYIFNFIDRSILGILLEPIKRDLQVSDTLMGFLGGIAFATFYTFLGIPIARLADRGSRRNVLAVCLALWSGATALCGLATNFVHLLLARIGVAVGEAGGSPPSHSMISDMFPPERRATALSIYALGIPIGTMLGNLGGGWINEAFDWRTAFMVVGLPGVLLALVVRFTLREPPRGAAEGLNLQAGAPQGPAPLPSSHGPQSLQLGSARGRPPAGEGVAQPTQPSAPSTELPSVWDVFRLLWSRRSFRYMALAGSLHAFVGYGVGYWIPAMFIRSHGLTTGQMGTALFYLGFASIAGTLMGGYLGDRLGAKDQRWYLWLPGLAIFVSLPFSLYAYTGDAPYMALGVLALPYLLGAYYLGPTFSLTQGLVGLRMRALAASILLFILNIIGLGLGPQFTGIVSDLLAATTDLGPDSLRWALVISLTFNLISAWLYMVAGKTIRADLAANRELG